MRYRMGAAGLLRLRDENPSSRSSSARGPRSKLFMTSNGGAFMPIPGEPPGYQQTQLPAHLSWRLLFLRRPLYRNLLRSPNPEGINIYEPAPHIGPTWQPLEALGNFKGWFIKTEQLQQDLSWMVKQQCVDLLAEGLWEELMDDEQPDITVMDWFEDSRLDTCVYELHVWLLAADRRSVIAQHHAAPRVSRRGCPGCWVQVSHVFRRYGSGVRFIHFMHKTKNRMEAGGLRRTRVTDSSVSVQLRE
ncbi:F-box only protein 50 [Echinops telfairi]|uniref:F-box only protein 50 n=1 Tax=Echinops telfairi TaxID=9371 RepID=A0ABM0IY84_ECHTE|nr:F-box only protein 50 [Echinops telfairi]